MKTDKKILKSASMVAGALLTTTLATTPSFGADILAYNHLGTGSQVRSHLIDQNVNQVNGAESTAYKFGELKCGEGKCGAEKAVEKTTEGKCGEGKCGAAGEAGKVMEAKCGEGKCGGSK